MENGILTKHEFISYSLTALSISITFILAILGIIGKIIIDKARIISIEDNKELSEKLEKRSAELEYEINQTKTNYILRFDEQKRMLHELDIKISKLSNDISSGLLKLENQINIIRERTKDYE